MSQLEQLQNIINPETYDTDYEDEYDEEDEYDSDYESSNYELSAQEQWDESMKQINGLINFIIFPLIGKILGRRFSHIIWRRIANWWFI